MKRNRLHVIVGVVVIVIAAAVFVLLYQQRGVAPTASLPDSQEADPNDPLLARIGDARLRHCGDIHYAKFHPNGKWVVAVAGGENGARLWDTFTGEQVARFTDSDLDPKNGRCTVLRFSPDGKRLVVGTERGQVVAFETDTGRVCSRFTADGFYTWDLGLASAGDFAAGFDTDHHLAVWDLDTGKRTFTGPKCEGKKIFYSRDGSACFSPDGKRIAVCKTASVVWWCPLADPTAGREIVVANSDGGRDGLLDLRWEDNTRLVARVENELLRIDADAGKLLGNEKFPERDPRWYAKSADGIREFHTNGNALRISEHVYREKPDPVMAEIERQPTGPAHVAWSADGTRLLAGLRVFTLDGGKPQLLREVEGSSYSNQFPMLSPDGRFCANTSRGFLGVSDLGTGQRVRDERPTHGPDQGGTQIVTSGRAKANSIWVDDGKLSEVELPSGKRLRRLPSLPGHALIVVASPDGRRLAGAGYLSFGVRDTEPGSDWTILEKYPEHQPCCSMPPPPCPETFAFHPDGRLFVLRDKLTIWSFDPVRSVTPAAVLEVGVSHRGLVFSPDGRWFAVATAPADLTRSELRVYETATLAEVYRLSPENGVFDFAFSADGRRLAVSHQDTTVSVYAADRLEAKQIGQGNAAKWADPDPKVGLAAVRAWAADPNSSVVELADQFRPANAQNTAALIADLGNADFATRERATEALAKLGASVEQELHDAVLSPTPEVNNRAEGLLKRLHPNDGRRSPDGLRAVRAVEALERRDSKESREVLAGWAEKRPDTVLGTEAKAALARLTTR